MYAMMMIELIYLLYTSTVYRLCTNSHANHCVLYAISSPISSLTVHHHQPRASARATAAVRSPATAPHAATATTAG